MTTSRDAAGVHEKLRVLLEKVKKGFEGHPLTETDRAIIAFQLEILERTNARLLKKAAKVDA
jgi:hypothetical protein